MFNFDNGYYLLSIDNAFMWSLVFCQVEYGSNYLEERFGYTESSAGMIIQQQYLIAAFLMPVFGYLIEKQGRII